MFILKNYEINYIIKFFCNKKPWTKTKTKKKRYASIRYECLECRATNTPIFFHGIKSHKFLSRCFSRNRNNYYYYLYDR